jgi:hypothetical protein
MMEKTRRQPKERLIEDRQLIMKDVQYMEGRSNSRGIIAQDKLSKRLRSLKPHLAEYFRKEEQDGFAQAVLVRAPQLERKVHSLMDEHAELARSLETLIRLAEDSESLDDGFREQLRAWVHRFREHESYENVLFEDAFNVECGAEDSAGASGTRQQGPSPQSLPALSGTTRGDERNRLRWDLLLLQSRSPTDAAVPAAPYLFHPFREVAS